MVIIPHLDELCWFFYDKWWTTIALITVYVLDTYTSATLSCNAPLLTKRYVGIKQSIHSYLGNALKRQATLHGYSHNSLVPKTSSESNDKWPHMDPQCFFLNPNTVYLIPKCTIMTNSFYDTRTINEKWNWNG